jgi:hypothetical protein
MWAAIFAMAVALAIALNLAAILLQDSDNARLQ